MIPFRRTHGIIGANLRPDFIPGGFSRHAFPSNRSAMHKSGTRPTKPCSSAGSCVNRMRGGVGTT